MNLDFKKPEELNVPNKLILQRWSTDIFQINQLGIHLSLPITFALLSKDAPNSTDPIDPDYLNPDLHQRYYDIKMMTYHCAWLGESLFVKLRTLNDIEKDKPASAQIITDFIDEKNKTRTPPITYEFLDFISHKDLLCVLLKEKAKIKALPFDRKPFCRLFDDIIKQRNNFIHGELLYFKTTEGYQTVLHSQSGYHILNKDVLNSYNECYKHLSSILSKALSYVTELT
ncbi:MAG: hypothetical protein JWO03_1754 [Bacteroidetes bacterium]|nr:hypothetical protein [Bacteroidota bacterium]